MTLVLAGISARNVYLSHATLTPVHSREECARILADSLPSARAVDGLRRKRRYQNGIAPTAALLGVAEDAVPVEVLVSSAGARRRRPELRCHTWSGPLFPGALCRVATGPEDEPLHVVSPALHFLLRCRELSAAQATLLGFQLCGTYGLRPDLETGFEKRLPQTNVGALRQAVASLEPGDPGVRVARTAVARLVDGAASPRESGFAAFLVTTRRAGGAGLPAPRLNHEVRLGGRARTHLPERRTIRYDFYWPSHRLACEYDSSWWHDDPERRGTDDQRRLAARAMGDDLIGLARATLSTPTMTEAAVDEITLALQRRRPRPLSAASRARREGLHRICFGHHSWW